MHKKGANKSERHRKYEETLRKGDYSIMSQIEEISQELVESQGLVKTQSAYNIALRKDLAGQVQLVSMYKLLYKKWQLRALLLSLALAAAIGIITAQLFALSK